MSVWTWILIGTVGVLAVSLLVSFTVAAILSTIGREASELIEFGASVSPPGTSADGRAVSGSEQQVTGHHARSW